MARENTSRYAVLGILSLKAMSGYDIRKAYGAGIVHFWSESYGQIYPILRRLAADRLVETRAEHKPGRPARKLYSLTPAGRAELRRWLEAPADTESMRSELLLKLYFGKQASPAVSVERLKRARRGHEERLAAYTAIGAALAASCGDHPDLPFWRITLDCGQRVSQAYRDWCTASIAALEAHPEAARPKATPRKRKGGGP